MNTNLPSIILENFQRQCFGFDSIFKDIERSVWQAHAAEPIGFPPYNIIKENRPSGDPADSGIYWRIEMAIAGFQEEDLEITLENETLKVKGSKSTSTNESETYIVSGLANRSFVKYFKISKDIEVQSVSLTNGILSIILKDITKKPEIKKIPINSSPHQLLEG